MDNFCLDLRYIVMKLCEVEKSLKKNFQQHLEKKVWDRKDHEKVLSLLSTFIISASESTCVAIAETCGSLTVDLLQRSTYDLQTQKLSELERISCHEKICISFGHLSSTSTPGLPEFIITYLQRNGSPFQRIPLFSKLEKNEFKKRKKMLPEWYEEVLKATYLLVMKYPVLTEFHWSWSDLITCLQSDCNISSKGKYFLKKCLACVFRLSTSSDTISSIEEEFMLDRHVRNYKNTATTQNQESKKNDDNTITSDYLSSCFTAVCGVVLHKDNFSTVSDFESKRDFVVTTSLRPQLQALALAVSEGQSVLLEGPVGCGKTALVEYLAELTGHSSPPYLTKVQLSDDTDSKTLTGTYVCSSVPGQFYWQSGLLVQACKEGYWVLLEDIDMAPMDVISLLLPIIECGQFAVPGHYSKDVEVSSRFRLFMTRRNTSSNSLVSSTGVNMMLKHAKVIKLNGIPEDDLKEVITTKFPNLATVVDKLLIIYQQLKENATSQISLFMQRKPSTRDLLKWCQRVSKHIDVHGVSDISVSVALSAMDCFVASCPRSDTRLLMTETINLELNISKDQAEYYCHAYKPTIENGKQSFQVGRSCIKKILSDDITNQLKSKQPFAFTRHSSVLLERIASSIEACEPVLLVGETGVGKTSALQYLAQETGRKLHVINMSQQSSSSDLLGGYKPAQLCHMVAPVKKEYERLFPKTFSQKQNEKFLTHIQTCFINRRYHDLWHLMLHSSKAAIKMLAKEEHRKVVLLSAWKRLLVELNDLKLKLKSDSPIAFNFVEGKLSQCIEKGDWLLLDEINLAGSDTLECLSCVLESESGSIVLMERGDAKPLARHKDFRLFAAMNPATDVGKRNLPEGVQNRFTEVFVDEPTQHSDIATIVAYYLNMRTVGGLAAVEGIVQFYVEVRKLATDKLMDGAGRKPHYSLRTLCRALRYVVDHSHVSLLKAFYEGFCLSFLTALDRSSHPLVVKLIVQHIIGRNNIKTVLSQPIPKPDFSCVEVTGHHIRRGPLDPYQMPHYIITASVKENLKELSRPVSYAKYPILIQGETSTGKTSLIKYLAAATGNKVIRINNHEHTDLQEYVGYYASDSQGKLVFQDGPLVTAMREGYWVILDELNLAPTDILEALNRVLDDNRELFITETQEVVRAHPRFTLFATQNPPGLYGGRKVLSRAFRNRFVEIHFDEIPTEELKIILHQRCSLSPSHSKKLIKVMQDLQARRKASGLFSGKHGFMTLRDLFRWAERHRRFEKPENELYDWEQHLVDDGFLLLAGKVRRVEEEKVIEEVLKKHFNRSVDHEKLFGMEAVAEVAKKLPHDFSHLVWTKPMRRLFVTLERALRFDEPVLLVGETGGGKTTACQLISKILNRNLWIVNCHANTEAADFIGGLRPARHRDHSEDSEDSKSVKLFEWVDGPLVQSMTTGGHILIDEISLADDSVLERLNSVLEPERTLVIPDKASMDDNDVVGDASAFVTAQDGFQFLATMNPGGDYGKKELSPALRNRMTEVWCDVIHEVDDLIAIVEHSLNLRLSSISKSEVMSSAAIYAKLIVDFVSWFKLTVFGKRFVISVRDLITWSNFMGIASNHLDLPSAYIHGACLVYIDGLGSGLSGAFAAQSAQAHAECLKFALKQLEKSDQYSKMADHCRRWLDAEINEQKDGVREVVKTKEEFGIKPFTVKVGTNLSFDDVHFSFNARTTSINALRVMRALQLPRPILLEGSPGGGKTSLVAAIAKEAGFNLVRINLSEQTDASDLFGADLPVENGKGGEFSWRDGPLLSAMKAGHWVVLDELNLASQSVLESLNSVFDHRGELYVPELDRLFEVDRVRTKIFACQNPLQEGGGRKGLPKSFLNRFTQVHVDNLTHGDLLLILASCFPLLPEEVLEKMVAFNQKVHQEVVLRKTWAHRGAPWEFNLRDLTRWCDLVVSDRRLDKLKAACDYSYLIYSERMRTAVDRKKLHDLFYDVVGLQAYVPSRYFHMTETTVQIGNALMKVRRNYFPSRALSALLVPSLLHPAESLITALNKNWPCILTGVSGSGKSLLVQIMAGLAGRKLRTLSMNSAMDAIELLGGYEQSDMVGTAMELLHSAIELLIQTCQVYFNATDSEKRLSQLQKLMLVGEKLKVLSQHIEMKQCENNSSDFLQEIETEVSAMTKFCKSTLPKCAYLKELEDILTRLASVFQQQETKGTYKWSDSVLVKALREGDWLLVDGANFCSASVLDRLNALLEPNGILTITERGVLDGKIPQIKPHKDFRLIFVLDPFHGELSRAMRNRCIEIHLPGEGFSDVHSLTDASKMGEQEGLSKDEVNLINQSKCSNFKEWSLWKDLSRQSDFTSLSNVDLLHRFDDVLARLRREIHHQLQPVSESTSPYRNQQLILHSPCIREFILDPHLSSALRQFKVFETYADLNQHSPEILTSSFCRLFIEQASAQDWNFRKLLVGKIFTEANVGSNYERLKEMFSNILNLVFSSPLLKQFKINDQTLPWDSRWALQSFPDSDISERMISCFSKLLLNVVFFQLQFEQDSSDSDVNVRNKKKFLKSATAFQIAKAFSAKRVLMTDLPHPALAFIIWFYRCWYKFVSDVLSCAHGPLIHVKEFSVCEGMLRRISFIWRSFMTSSFALSSFTTAYLSLRKEILNFSRLLTDKTSSVTKDLRTAFENLDKVLQVDCDFEKEDKFQNHLRSRLATDVCLFMDQQQCTLHTSLFSLLADFSDHVENALVSRSMTKLSWTQVLNILDQLIQVYDSLKSFRCKTPSQNHEDSMEIDDSYCVSLNSLLCRLQDGGVKFSTSTKDLLKFINIDFNETEPVEELSICAFGHSKLDQQISTLKNYTLTLSQLAHFASLLTTSDTEKATTTLRRVLPQLPTVNLNMCFKMLMVFQAEPCTFAFRNFMFSKLLHWSQFFKNISEQEKLLTDAVQDFDGIANLISPYICQSAADILYEGIARNARLDVSSLQQVKRTLWNSARVPLGDVADKVRQLDGFLSCLWANATLYSQAQCQVSNISLPCQLFNLITGLLITLTALLQASHCSDEKSNLLANKDFLALCNTFHQQLKPFTSIQDSRAGLISAIHNLYVAVSALSNLPAAEHSSPWSELLVNVFSKCLTAIVKTLDLLKSNKVESSCQKKEFVLNCWLQTGEAWVWCGYLHLLLVSPRGAVDPIEKSKAKVECYTAELSQLDCDLEIHKLSYQNLTGRQLILEDKILDSFSHPNIQASLDHLTETRKKIEKNSLKSAYRPSGAEFLKLSKLCISFLSTVGSITSLEELILKLSSNSKIVHELAVKMEGKTQESYNSFTRSLSDDFPAYPDFVSPVTDSINQIRFGLKLMKSSTVILFAHNEQHKRLTSFSRSSLTPELFLTQHLNGDYSADEINDFVSLLKSMNLGEGKDKFATDKIIDNLLMSSLLRMRTAVLRSPHCSGSYNEMVRILEIIIVVWNKRQKLIEERELERTSLFKYKEKSHIIDTEEVQEEKEFKAMFPTFEGDVADLQEDVLNGDPPVNEDAEQKEDEDLELTKKAFDLATTLHRNLLTNLFDDNQEKKRKQDAKTNCSDDIIFSSLLSHFVFSLSIKDQLPLLYGGELDHSLISNHIITCCKLKEILSSESYADVKKEELNVYNESLPSEISKCLPVLHEMRSSVAAMLNEWPDHPVLSVLVKIIDRILSYSITSPVMKFVSGLEFLLARAQDWESNAGHHVSLAKHLEAVTSLVIEWRKIELKSWYRLLNDTRKKTDQDLPKWWYFIYQLVEDCVEKTKQEANKSLTVEVVTSLQKFIESSTIGQFKGRVELLIVFYRHLVIKGYGKDQLATALSNMYNYYNQFVAASDERIEFLRKPIEKEMTDFVKIAKWNDLNFYAVKQSVTKTHRTLFKLKNKFYKTLREPVTTTVLNVTAPTFSSVTESSQSTGLAIALRWKDVAEKIIPNSKEASNAKLIAILQSFFNAEAKKEIQKEIQRLPTILLKLNKHCATWMREVNGFMPDLLANFENLTTNIIVNFKELRALEPSTPLSKDEELRNKRLSEAKHIHARKRRALSELFKLLRLIGLSYRKGLVWGKTFDSRDAMLTQSPEALKLHNTHNKFLNAICNDALSGSQSYFYKMISRWSALIATAVTPNKEVIGSNLDRLHGFVEHLVCVAVDQRRNVAILLNSSIEIQELLFNLKAQLQNQEDHALPSHEDTLGRLITCRKASNHWSDALYHFKQLIKSCPRSFDNNSTFVPPNTALPRAARCCYGDEVINDVIHRVSDEIGLVDELRRQLEDEIAKYYSKAGELKQGVLIMPSVLSTIDSSARKLRESTERVCREMSGHFDSNDVVNEPLDNQLVHSPLLFHLLQGRKNVHKHTEVLLSDQEQPAADVSNDDVVEQLNNLLSQVMLSVQQLVKNNSGMQDAGKIDEDLYEDHFIYHLHNRSNEYFRYLNSEEINLNLMKLMSDVRNMTGASHNKQVFSLLLHSLVPLLEEYLTLVRFVVMVTSLVSRSTCKFAYILASIFAEVVSKGFCPPPEFEEEIEGEKGELKEVEDAGIGEGEGKKDVSEQIEDESQVEDRPEEEKEDQKDDIPGEDNAVEMSNDFEGKFQDNEQMEKEDQEELENEEEELDKQMGDLGDEKETEKLDERMWGSEDEDEDEEQSEKKEEKGKGMDADESELKAKDEELQTGEENEDLGDQSEFNPDERDDIHEQEPIQSPEPLELPEDYDVCDADEGPDEKEEDNDATEDDNGQEEDRANDDSKDLPPETEDETALDADEQAAEEEQKDEEVENKDETQNEKEETPEGASDEEEDKGGDEKPAEEAPTQEEAKEENREDREKEEEKEHGGPEKQLPLEEEQNEEKKKEETKRSDHVETKDDVVQCETANEEVMKQAVEEGKDKEKSGMAPSADQHGDESSLAAPQSIQDSRTDRERATENEKKVGESDAKRSLGEAEDVLPKKLKLMDDLKEKEEDEKESNERCENADMYQHIAEDVRQYDKQTRDAATEEQMKEQPVEHEEEKDAETNLSDHEENSEKDAAVEFTEMEDDATTAECKPVPIVDEDMIVDANQAEDVKEKSCRVKNEEVEERDLPPSSIHTNFLDWESSSEMMALTPEQIAEYRQEMESHLRSISSIESSVEFAEAEVMWHQYQNLTQPLSQQLSEQLRLILEPSRAAKLKGDYRTGKRLNMRKVIPYIASGFRKDKIWLRRSKPSKREYQIMVAIDDSSSMADNHTKQLAFESLAVISAALTTIEAGQLSVCNFGEETKLLHDFNQPFTDRSGAAILQQCSFKQEQTRIAQLLDSCVKFLKTAQSNYTSVADPRLSQLLLIVSDGRGLYIEGKERVEAAVRAAKDAGVFLAFVILDNPAMKDSILDIKVPVFRQAGKIDIRSYIADFPFPFYVIIRDINSLPETLSEALRQWFEIVTSGD